jgi:O-antigen ligase
MEPDASTGQVNFPERLGRLTLAGLVAAAGVVTLLGISHSATQAAGTIVAVLIIFLCLTKFPGLAAGILMAAILANVPYIAASRYGIPHPGVVLFLGIMAVLIVRVLLGLEDPTSIVLLGVAAATYCSFASLALLWVDDITPTLNSLKELTKGWLIAILILGLTTTPERLRTAARTIVVVMSLVAGLACIQYLSGVFDQTFLGFANAQVKHIAGDLSSWRSTGPLPDPNAFAQTLVIALPLAVVSAVVDPKWYFRFIGILGVPIVAAALSFTYSRGGLAGLGVMGIVGVLLVRRRWPILSLALVLVVLAMAVEPEGLLRRVGAAVQAMQALLNGQDLIEDSSLSQRVGQIAVGLHMFAQHPVLGIGIGQYGIQYPDYALRYGYDISSPPEAHNRFVEVLAENGLTGFTMFLVLCIVSIVIAYKGACALVAVGRASEAAILKAAIAGFAGYLTTLVFLHDAFSRFFWLQIGLLMSAWWFLPVKVCDRIEGRTCE